MGEDNEIVKILKIDVSEAEGQINRLQSVLDGLGKSIDTITDRLDVMATAFSGLESPELDFSALNTSVLEAEGYIRELKSSLDGIQVPDISLDGLNNALNLAQERMEELRQAINPLKGEIVLETPEIPTIEVPVTVSGFEIPAAEAPTITVPVVLEEPVLPEMPEIPTLTGEVVFNVEKPDIEAPTLEVPVDYDLQPLELPEIEPITVDVDFDVDTLELPQPEPITVPVEAEITGFDIPQPDPVEIPVTFDTEDVHIPDIDPIEIPVTFNEEDVKIPDIEPITVPVNVEVPDIEIPTPEPVIIPVESDLSGFQLPEPEEITVPVHFDVEPLNLPSVEPITTEVVIDTAEAQSALDGLISSLNEVKAIIDTVSFPELAVPQLGDIQAPAIDLQAVIDTVYAGFQSINTAFEQFVNGISEGVQLAIQDIQELGDEISAVKSPEFDPSSTKDIRDRIDELRASLVGLDETSSEYSATVQEITRLQAGLTDAMGVSFGSMREAKAYCDSLRSSLVTLEEGSDEYIAVANRLREVQDGINAAMSVGKSTYDGASDSINGMRRELRDLVRQYDALSKADRESEFGQNLKQQIKTTTDELKQLEGETGRFQRNVGNYANDVSKALQGIGISAGSSIAPVRNLEAAVDALAANPWVAAIAAAIAMLLELRDAFKRDEDATNDLNNALAPFQAVLNEVKRAFDRFLDTIKPTIEKLKELKGVQAVLNVLMSTARRFVNAINMTLEVTAEALDKVAYYGNRIEDWLAKTGIARFFDNLRKKVVQLNNWLADTWLGSVLGIEEMQESLEKFNDSIDDSTQRIREINNAETALNKERRRVLVENSKLQAEANELRAKAQDQENYTHSQRLKYLKEAQAAEEKLHNNAVRIAQEELALERKKQSLNKTGKEGLDAIARAEANLNNTIAAQSRMREQYNRQTTRIRKQELREARTLSKELYDNQKKMIENEIKLAQKGSREEYDLKVELAELEHKRTVQTYNETVKDITQRNTLIKQADGQLARQLEQLALDYQQAITRITVDEMRVRQGQYRKNTVEWLETQWNILDTEYREMVQGLEETDAEFELRKQAKADETFNVFRQLREQRNKEEIAQLQIDVDRTERNSERRLKAEAKVLEKELEQLEKYGRDSYNSEVEWQEAIEKKKLEIRQKYADIANSKLDRQEATLELNVVNTSDYGWERLVAERELVKFQLDNIQREEGESEERYLLRKAQMEKEYADKSRQIIEAQIGYWSDFATSIGDIFATIADYYKDDIQKRLDSGKISEEQAKKEFERVKALEIAQATIDTISGAIAAYMSYQKFQPGGAILGAIQAAAVTAAGIAQIAKIRATTLNSPSTPTPVQAASVNPNISNYTNNYTYTTTGVDELTTINNTLTNGFNRIERRSNTQRFYVLESDITTVQNKAKGRVRETTF